MDLVLTKRSHHFLVTNLSKLGRSIAAQFSRQFIEYDLVPNPGGRGFRKEATRVYACANSDLTEFRFHINCLPEFLKVLDTHGLLEKKDYLIHTQAIKPAPEVQFELQEGWSDRDHQVPAIEYIIDRQSYKAKFINMQTGKGKAQPNESKVRVAGGWTTMGDIALKKQIINPDGTVQYVEYTVDHGPKDIYTVRFADGRETKCSGDHLWEVFDEIGQQKVVTTDWLREETDQELDSFFIQLIDPEQRPEVESHEDRYKYGQVIGKVAEIAYDTGFSAKQSMFEGSVKQRRQLLRGIFCEQASFTNVQVGVFITDCYELVRQLRALCWSLGCAAYCDEKEGMFHVTVQAQHLGQSVYLPFSSIVYDRTDNVRCISVSNSNKLYITDDYLPTHNSYIGMRAAQELQARTVYIFKNKYIDKWIVDLTKTYKITAKEILIIKGAGSLLKLCKRAAKGEELERVILISNATFRSWIKTYEKTPNKLDLEGWPFLPDQFFEKVGAGFRIVDELHEDFHFNFKLDLYTHIEDSASFSATLTDNDPFKMRMYELMHPPETRFNGGGYDAYVHTTAYLYRFSRPSRIQTTEYGDTKYSHHAIERSILKDKETAMSYFVMVDALLNDLYFSKKDVGEKAVIFFASINMCTAFTNYLKKKYPQYVINRYVEDDPYENLMGSDISVTTILSAGTGVDIPMLRTGIMTTGIDSPKANLQAFGRTRKMESGNTPFFGYLACEDVPKSMEYHRNKVELLTPRSKDFVIAKHDTYLSFTER